MNTKALGYFEVKDEARGFVQAVFSSFDTIDADGDVTKADAFTDGAPVRISAWGHQSHFGALPVGKGRIRTTPTEAILDGRFFLNTQAGLDTFITVRELAELQEWSYGFRIVKSSPGEFNGRRVRFLEKLTVDEVSPVMIGAGIGTRTLAVKRDQARSVTHEELLDIFHQNEVRGLKMEFDRIVDRVSNDPYIEVPKSTIPRPVVEAATDYADSSARALGVDIPEVRWFEKSFRYECDRDKDAVVFTYKTGTHLRGLTHKYAKTIWLHHRLSPFQAKTVAAHEVAHIAGHDEDHAEGFAQYHYYQRTLAS